jgi:hypothetical protein
LLRATAKFCRWAPNRGHSHNYAKNVRKALEEADNVIGTRKAIVEALQKQGKAFIEGTNL